MMLPDVLTVDAVAELLDCSTDTVEDEARRRRLPALKFGRGWIFPREALLQVLTQRALAHLTVPASPAPAPKVVAMVSRPQQRQQRARGRSPAPLADPPIGRT